MLFSEIGQLSFRCSCILFLSVLFNLNLRAIEPSNEDGGESALKVQLKLKEADELLAKGQAKEAEARLLEGIQSKPDTPQWYQEKATDMSRIAFSRQEAGDNKNAREAAQLALDLLATAQQLAKDNEEILADILEFKAVLAERILGDSIGAAADSEKASQIKSAKQGK